MNSSRDQAWIQVLGVAAFGGLAVALWAIFVYAPTELTMGIVQRIYYVHLASAIAAAAAFAVVFAASLAYLWPVFRHGLVWLPMRLYAGSRDRLRPWLRGSAWDRLAVSSVEVGLLFTTLVLITGPLWGRPVWGSFWVWEPTLTLTLVLWLIYVGYLMLRSYLDDPRRRARFSAVLGIVGFVDVPLIRISVVMWRGLHPQGPGLTGGNLSGEMRTTLVITILAFLLTYAYLLVHRVRLERLREDVAELKEMAEAGGVA
ncbi:MAG: cytochrome c biogenesis protein CcsA [Anaerolineae bacterium]